MASKDDEKVQYESCSVNVAVRCRPMNEREKLMGAVSCVQFMPPKSLKISPPTGLGGYGGAMAHNFTFDHVYDEVSEQQAVFLDIGRPVLAATFTGFNTCIFAYGQTGSGKSHTMMGPAGGQDVTTDPGIIPRLCTELFQNIRDREEENAAQLAEHSAKRGRPEDCPPALKHQVELTYVEIYQERVKCLLNPNRDNLKVRQHPKLGVFVEGLTRIAVTSYSEVFECIEGGNNVRHVACTNMNERSSRSHAIFTLIVTQRRLMHTRVGDNVNERVARVNLVDLAGSERVKSTGAEGDVLREGANINKSLSVLGSVISALAEASKPGGKKQHVPFRDSQLTWLLKENLGGNSKTFMLSAISPADVHFDESLSTLRYADRAKQIVTKACVNEDPKTKLIRELKEELAMYKKRCQEYEMRRHGHAPAASLLSSEGVGVGTDASGGTRSAEGDDTPIMVPRLNIGRVAGSRLKPGSLGSPSSSPMPSPQPRLSISEDAGDEEDEEEQAEMLGTLLDELLLSDEQLAARQAKEREDRAEAMKRLTETTVKVERDDPYLMNLENCGDWVIEYLVDDVTYVGSKPLAGAGPGARGIVVDQPDVLPRHCIFIRNLNGSVSVRPLPNAPTYIDDGEAPLKSDFLLTPGQTIQCGEFANMKFVDRLAAPMSSRKTRMQFSLAKQGTASSPTEPRPIIPKLSLLSQGTDDSRGPPKSSSSGTNRPTPVRIATPRLTNTPQYISQPMEPLVTAHRHMYVLLGDTGTGKSALRACLTKAERGFFSLPWLSKRLPETVPTLGFEIVTHTVGQQNQVTLTFLEMSGLDSFAALHALIPETRLTFLLCWRLIDPGDLSSFRKYLDLIQGRSPSRDNEIILVATCRDLVDAKDSEILQSLADTQVHLSTYMSYVESVEARRPRIVNRFAVSCKERTVLGPSSSIKKMADLIAYLGDYAVLRSRADVEFPNGMVPRRILALEKKIQELRKQGKWIIPSQEYKVYARVVDARYDRSVEELHRHTQLLVSWGQLNHQFRHMFIKKYVVLDIDWVFRVLTTLCCCVSPLTRYVEGGEQMAMEDVASLTPTTPQGSTLHTSFPSAIFAFGSRLPFDIDEVRKKDIHGFVCRGILTMPVAEVMFASLLRSRNMDMNDIGRIFDLLEKYDLLMPGSKIFTKLVGNTSFCFLRRAIDNEPSVEPPESSEKPIKFLEDDDDLDNPEDSERPPREDFFLIPSCFNTLVPTAVTLHLDHVLLGPSFRFSFNIVPPFFFPRLVARIALYCSKVYVGPVSTGISNGHTVVHSAAFWCNCIWIVSASTSRALVRMVHRSLFVTFHDPRPDDEFRNGIREAMRSVIGEAPGVKFEENVKCESCEQWIRPDFGGLDDDSPVNCEKCGKPPDRDLQEMVQGFHPEEFIEHVLKDSFVTDATKTRLERCAHHVAEGRKTGNWIREGRGVDSLVDTLASF